MHGTLGKKKPEEALLESQKKEEEQMKKPMQPLLSMTEGPMQLKDERQDTAQHEKERRISVGTAIGVQLINESKQIEEMGRKSYEKSVELELAAMKKAPKKGKKKPAGKKKPRYGWRMDAEPLPPDK